MMHDPLCPNIAEWYDEETAILWGTICHCGLIAKVRQDERERAGIQQTVPSHEYPFSTSVTVEAAMTEMNRFKWTSFGPWLDEDGPFVLHADAEAAIAAAQAKMSDGQSVILASECEKRIAEARTAMTDFQQGVKAGYATRLTDVDDLVREAKADMLANCVAAVESLTFFSGDDKEQALASMRALQGKP
jgi:hypothetical protein